MKQTRTVRGTAGIRLRGWGHLGTWHRGFRTAAGQTGAAPQICAPGSRQGGWPRGRAPVPSQPTSIRRYQQFLQNHPLISCELGIVLTNADPQQCLQVNKDERVDESEDSSGVRPGCCCSPRKAATPCILLPPHLQHSLGRLKADLLSWQNGPFVDEKISYY